MQNGNVAFQRSKVYKLLSYCFLYPSEELSEFLLGRAFMNEMKKALKGAVRGPSCTSLEFLMPRSSFSRELLMGEYVRFLTLKSKCPPYETEYRSEISPFPANEVADIAGFYRAFGMNFVKDRPDFIGTELEFMHLVTLKEAGAAAEGDRRRVPLCISTQKKFLTEHLGRWVDGYEEALFAEESLVYRPVTSFIRRWIDLECKGLGLSPQKI